MKKSFLAIIIALAVIFQIRCSAGTDSNAQQALPAEENKVGISHNIPPEVLLTDLPFTASFSVDIVSGVEDIAYYAIQASELKTTYLPNGIYHEDIAVPVDLRQQDVTMLIVAANSSGSMTREEIKLTLNTDCPGCDLGWYGPNNSGRFSGIDFCGADLSYAKMRNLSLQDTSFCGANLIGVDFTSDLPDSWMVLHGSQFVGADLRFALFVNTALIGIDFSNADMTGADLTNTEISGCTWDNTTCPDGTNSDNNGNTCVNNLLGG
jgi:uncharacterized protein YjbI with pentapeptide repeats